MGLDIRFPIGLMFTLIGLIMAIYGGMTHGNTEMYARSNGVNINLIWGVVQIIFGLCMLVPAIVAKKKQDNDKK